MIIDPEFKSLIPPLTEDERRGLERSILAEGCRDALVCWGDTLIDGHNRYDICTRHDIPFKTVHRDFANRESAMEWIITNQFGRRNLPAYERARLALRLKPILAEKAKERQYLGLKSDEGGRTDAEIAKAAGVGRDTIAKVAKIEETATPEVKEQLRNGELTINRAYQNIRREEKRADIYQRIHDHADAQTGAVNIYDAEKKYNIIYADPPWKYWDGGWKNQSVHYPTMTIDDICALPVADIAADDAILFLWVTYPTLPDAFKVMEAWGFEYATAGFVWVKRNKLQDTPFIGCGSWTRANSELCLIGTRGNPMRLDAGISQVVESPIEEHSKKPDIVRDLITHLVGELPRVELFCRHPADGWDVWGFEV